MTVSNQIEIKTLKLNRAYFDKGSLFLSEETFKIRISFDAKNVKTIKDVSFSLILSFDEVPHWSHEADIRNISLIPKVELH